MKSWVGLLFFSYVSIFSQANEMLNFYPLHVGDIWQYEITYQPETGRPEVFYSVKKVLGDTTLENGKKYFLIEQPPFTYQRILSLEKILVRIDSVSGSVLRFDQNKKIDIQIDSLYAKINDFVSSLSVYRTKDLQIQIFNLENTLIRNVHSQLSSDLHYYWRLAYNIGLYYQENHSSFVTSFGNKYQLVYAKIDGKEFGKFVSAKNEDDLPSGFYIYQNYPNPFNSITNIKYSVPSSIITNYKTQHHVLLKIYNSLGQEIETIVDEEKLPGNYEVRFDAGELTSGVYFYKFQSGRFSEIKKLVLMK